MNEERGEKASNVDESPPLIKPVEENEKLFDLYKMASKKRGAVLINGEISLYNQDGVELSIAPDGEGTFHGISRTTTIDEDELREALNSIPESRSSVMPSAKDHEAFYFLALLREKEYHLIPSSCFNQNARVEVDGNTITIFADPNKMGKMIGRGGVNIKPFSDAARANGYRLVLKQDDTIVARESTLREKSRAEELQRKQTEKETLEKSDRARMLEYEKYSLKNKITYFEKLLTHRELIDKTLKVVIKDLVNKFEQNGFYDQRDVSSALGIIEIKFSNSISYKNFPTKEDERAQREIEDKSIAIRAFISLMNSELKDEKFRSVEELIVASKLIFEMAAAQLNLSQEKLAELVRSEK